MEMKDGWFANSNYRNSICHYFWDGAAGCNEKILWKPSLVRPRPDQEQCGICEGVARYKELEKGPCPCESGLPFADCHGKTQDEGETHGEGDASSGIGSPAGEAAQER